MGFDAVKFRDFIRAKFAEWRGAGRDSLADYAAFIGISQQLMSKWYMGKLKRAPDLQTYNLLIRRYGVEAYDVLGIPRPSEDAALSGLSDELSSAIKSALAEIRSTDLNNGKAMASPEDLEMINAILKKHLGKYISS